MDIYQEGTKIAGAAHLISDASISVDRVVDNNDGSPTAPHMSDLLYVHETEDLTERYSCIQRKQIKKGKS